MLFRVKASTSVDETTPAMDLALPAAPPLGPADVTRAVSLNEEESKSVNVIEDESGNIVLDCAEGEVFGPTSALLGVLNETGQGVPLLWNDGITENPAVGDTEVWEIHNHTADAHPIHVHLTAIARFQAICND